MPTHPVARWTRRACAAAALALVACASAEKRMNQGLALEQRGRPADAAARYVEALRKDPSLATARARLQESGDRAVPDILAESAALEPGAGADALLRLDELRRDAMAVGVQLATPADLAQRRRAVFDRAIAESIARAGRAAEGGSFSTVLNRLDRAAARWEPSPQQRAEVDRARFDTRLGWADAAMRAGEYRAAYDRAQAAGQPYNRESGEYGRAREIQDEALRLGTVRVAMLPLGTEPAARRRIPDDLVPALNDELDNNQWTRAPLFVEVVDPRLVHGSPQRYGYARQALTLRDAAEMGRMAEADLALRAAIDSVEVVESGVRETRRPARTTSGVDTAYVVREGRRALRIRVVYSLVDVEHYTESRPEVVWASGDSDFVEALYRGNPRELSISSRERDLFEARPRRELVGEIIRELAPRLQRDVFDRVLMGVR